MGNELSTNERADGRPVLATMALSPRRWTTDEAVAVAGSDVHEAIASAIAYIDVAFWPVPTDAKARDGWKAAMDERLRRLAIKIAPGMQPAQTQPFRDVLVEALSDLPAMVALTAAKRALHQQMDFLNQIEKVVREIAATVIAERRAARGRLEDLARDLSRPRRAALPPQEDGAPLSLDEIRKMSAHMRSLGISTGFISAEQLAEVEAAERAEAA
ncbi:hypothetical protein [Sphingomonas abietis]|uniref:DUF3486 family protein n=1 Tax=Sphingomonas abietis TaxID=3012344 RepID=A0ABY7NQY0_9SPHN|nr:hypothetical protein [Sphingomonas abietis]WBO23949.1 hypothetical protein PBT88_07520 [Sphingomonas abietis]